MEGYQGHISPRGGAFKQGDFLDAFRENYFLKSVRDEEVEILELTQGSMTVFQYKIKFTELVRYAPHIVLDDTRKAKKF